MDFGASEASSGREWILMREAHHTGKIVRSEHSKRIDLMREAHQTGKSERNELSKRMDFDARSASDR